ncbi:hypothetical protein KIPB_012822 [Kipferlia bialata]|uniref:Uncharacterized protein n=1 Tax=Kipferlia bialata TaxID=797122 RepID=A0A9K3D6P1_9EUKA|nr:hypothetical protein KIPB_012822 [Kipferlia bialata]|eukprot:g12822.t1
MTLEETGDTLELTGEDTNTGPVGNHWLCHVFKSGRRLYTLGPGTVLLLNPRMRTQIDSCYHNNVVYSPYYCRHRDFTHHHTTEWAVIGSDIHMIDTDSVEETACHSSFSMTTHKYSMNQEMPFEHANLALPTHKYTKHKEIPFEV